MLLVVVFGVLLVGTLMYWAYTKGFREGLEQRKQHPIHIVKEGVKTIQITYFDEYDCVKETFEYREDNGWLSGYKKTITK